MGKQGVLGDITDYRGKEFMYNKWLPYAQKATTATGLMGAGVQNIFGSFNDLASAGYLIGSGIEDRNKSKVDNPYI
ncbi:MAG: hypothetical protein ACFFKA_16310 [Candidatus Thorarchaeota archaeon]